MKKIVYATGLLALMAAATSCDKYDIYPEEFDSVFALRDAGSRNLTVYSTDEVAEVPFVIMKGGYDPASPAKATLKAMSDAEFEAYKESSGNALFTAVSPDCYSFSQADDVYELNYTFSDAKQKYETATLYVRPANLQTWLSQNGADLGNKSACIPVTLVSSTDTVSSYNNVVLVNLDLRTPELTVDVEGIVGRIANCENWVDGEEQIYTPDGNLSIPCNNPWGFTLNVTGDDANLAAYNEENHTSYLPLPEGSYELATAYHFAPGTTYMPIDLKIDLRKLDLLRNYAICIKLDQENPITWDSDYNPGEALKINKDMVLVYSVKVVQAVALQKVPLSTANVTTNDQEPTEGALSGLFDGDTGTFFHTGWSVANPREATYGAYLQITLPQEMSMFRFDLTNRNSATAAGYAKKVCLFGSNDIENWPTTPFKTIDDMNQILNGAAVKGEFGTDEEPFMSDVPVKYLRFCVLETGGGSLGTASTAVYWCASEFNLYGF